MDFSFESPDTPIIARMEHQRKADRLKWKAFELCMDFEAHELFPGGWDGSRCAILLANLASRPAFLRKIPLPSLRPTRVIDQGSKPETPPVV
jgi:hypothetical protein